MRVDRPKHPSKNGGPGNSVRWAKSTDEIRWTDVVRIQATGTDVFGPFQVWLTFTYANLTELAVGKEAKGYNALVKGLNRWIPGLSPKWLAEMAQSPWHAEALLFGGGVKLSCDPATGEVTAMEPR